MYFHLGSKGFLNMAHRIITISRQYGSGGRSVGRKIADKFDMEFFDKELLEAAAKKSGISKELFEMHDEKPTSSFLFSLVSDGYFFGYPSVNSYNDMPISQRVFLVQFDTIKEIAREKSCVIVGRCADYALADFDDVVNVFISANMETRIQNVMHETGQSEEKARDLIAKVDKRRASYYNYYTNKKWGACESYDLCINSSMVGIDGCVETIVKFSDLITK